MANETFHGLLVRLSGSGASRLAAAPQKMKLSAAGIPFELEPLFATKSPADRTGFAAPATNAEWYRARPANGDIAAHPWELAYEVMSRGAGLGLSTSAAPDIIEPDLLQDWLYEPPGGEAMTLAAAGGGFDDQNTKLPRKSGVFAWHLTDEFSQLRRARDAAAAGAANLIRIVHLDTGYDPDHSTFPKTRIDSELQRNFVDDNNSRDARDPKNSGLLKNPGHGTGTLSILAGERFKFSEFGYSFDDVLGGAPAARIVPVRVGNSVVQFSTSSVARGINHAVELCEDPNTRVHVISMSMGGVASAAWADAVNNAYEAGIVFVAAAGNNFSGLPTRFIVYPARFHRVIAACGVMANRKPYWGLGLGVMQGNWGPDSKMGTALSAFTPNIPWAEISAADIVDMNGQGTSAATPQVAAAAALYFQTHARTLFDTTKYPQPWMRVEAVRQALFGRADRSADSGRRDKLGNGILKAADALGAAPPDRTTLKQTKRDSATFAFLRALTGLGAASSPIDGMLELEATQLSQRWPRDAGPNPFEAIVSDPDREGERISPEEQRRFFEAILDHPQASKQLKRRADAARGALGGGGGGGRSVSTGKKQPASPPGSDDVTSNGHTMTAVGFEPPIPPFRSLRGFAFDPSLSTTLETVRISEVLFDVPWEKLQKGPVGKYLEVIDIDPASQCFYEPVDLEDPLILAQDGLPPSEGTAQFHQQMVYAVASLTIENFEHALGRSILWRAGPSRDPNNKYDDSRYVQRLRIYPHALREPNAYYSPQKIGLLFGYFTASDDNPGEHLPGAQVFTCLSHDIIAHETTHALLDGMHRQFLIASNPDVRAFHEAFADIVALLQHFTFPEILRHQISSTRGDIRSHQSLLGSLATQFGLTTGRRGALRDAIGTMKDGRWVPHERKPNEYLEAKTPHERGSFLVAAVFDAFISIYEHRVSDLLRLATDGTGILRPGAIHPDLVKRLADEAAKSAQHVLTMCVRALDYCPPTDITFGEYLRAIITADYDLVRDDDLNYRVAFIEAFRRRGIYPRDVRTLSIESLLWRGPGNSNPPPSAKLAAVLDQLRPFATDHMYAKTRKDVFDLQRKMRGKLHQWLKTHLSSGSEGMNDAEFLGIDQRRGFEVNTARFALRTKPDGGLESQLILGLIQRNKVALRPGDAAAGMMTFEGGCTLVAELGSQSIRYCIRKNMTSDTRLQRQQEFRLSSLESPRATYLGSRNVGNDDENEVDEFVDGMEPFALLHRGF